MDDVKPFAGLAPPNRKGPGLTPDEIGELETSLGRSLPDEYAAFLRWSNGWEGLHGSASVVLAPAEDLVWMNDDTFRDAFPGLVDIGGDGGLESFAFDYREASTAPGLVALDRVSASPEDIWPLASGFVEGLNFLAKRHE